MPPPQQGPPLLAELGDGTPALVCHQHPVKVARAQHGHVLEPFHPQGPARGSLEVSLHGSSSMVGVSGTVPGKAQH